MADTIPPLEPVPNAPSELGLPNREVHSSHETSKRIRLVLNLTGAGDDRLRDAVEALRSRGHGVDVRVAWDGADAVPFAREAARQGYDVVAAGGGDGTVNAVVRGLIEAGSAATGTALGIVPFGTANDLATSCGLRADDLAPLLELLVRGTPRRIDIGRMNETPFINVASGGYAAEITAETDPGMKKLLGGLAYWLTGISRIARIEPRPVRVVADDFRWEGNVLAVAVCNGRRAGGGLALAPGAWLDDGLLDLAIIPDVPWTEFLDLYAELQALADEPPDRIVSRQARRILIEAPDGLQINLDGEPHHGDRFEFSIEPSRLTALLPLRCAPLRGDASASVVNH